MVDGIGPDNLENSYKDLVIITTTFYKEDEVGRLRSELALRTLQNANELEIACVVVDGGSFPDFLEKAEALPNVTLDVDEKLGMGESRRRALEIAQERYPENYVLWAEPEKDDLIKETNLDPMLEKLRKQEADIIVPKRISFESCPKFQAWIEKRANRRVAEQNGVRDKRGDILDLWFGPKMFNKQGAKFFANYTKSSDEEKLDLWDSIIAPVIEAHKKGLLIDSTPADYTYSPEQLQQESLYEDEFNQKRWTQYKKILPELNDSLWRQCKEGSVAKPEVVEHPDISEAQSGQDTGDYSEKFGAGHSPEGRGN